MCYVHGLQCKHDTSCRGYYPVNLVGHHHRCCPLDLGVKQYFGYITPSCLCQHTESTHSVDLVGHHHLHCPPPLQLSRAVLWLHYPPHPCANTLYQLTRSTLLATTIWMAPSTVEYSSTSFIHKSSMLSNVSARVTSYTATRKGGEDSTHASVHQARTRLLCAVPRATSIRLGRACYARS